MLVDKNNVLVLFVFFAGLNVSAKTKPKEPNNSKRKGDLILININSTPHMLTTPSFNTSTMELRSTSWCFW